MENEENDFFKHNAKTRNEQKYLTTQDAMKRLKVSRSTLYRLRKKKSIPSSNIGGRPIYIEGLLDKMHTNRSIQNYKNPTDKKPIDKKPKDDNN